MRPWRSSATSTAEPDHFRQLYALAAGDDRIRFAGGIPNEHIPERLARIDVQVVPSIWYENAPLTIYSAQAAGVPVVASDLGACRRLSPTRQNGLLFESGNAADLTAQLAPVRRPGPGRPTRGERQMPMTAARRCRRAAGALRGDSRRASPARVAGRAEVRARPQRRAPDPSGAKAPPVPAPRSAGSAPGPVALRTEAARSPGSTRS